VQFDAGSENQVWKSFTVGQDGLFHLASNQTNTLNNFGTIGLHDRGGPTYNPIQSPSIENEEAPLHYTNTALLVTAIGFGGWLRLMRKLTSDGWWNPLRHRDAER